MKRRTLDLLTVFCLLMVLGSCRQKDGPGTDTRPSDTSMSLEDMPDTTVIDERFAVDKKRRLTEIEMKAVPLECYPDHCEDANACKPECIGEIEKCHRITEGRFDSMTSRFSRIGHRARRISEIRSLINNAVCNLHTIKLKGDFVGIAAGSNDDISFDVVESKMLIDSVYYSIALFKGILARDPERITFFKALRGDTASDIVMRVSYSLTNSEYYDLSDIPPAH